MSHLGRRAAVACESTIASLCAALEGVADGVWDLDLQAGTVWCSPGWYLALGCARDAIPPEDHRLPWTALVHPDDAETHRLALAAHLDGRSPAYRAELRLRGPGGPWHWAMSRGKVVAWAPDGSPWRLVGTQVDISAWKELARRAELAEERLRDVDALQTVGRLARGIAHDLNNQMNTILLLGDRLGRGAADPDTVRRYAEMVVCRAASSSELTRKLIGYPRHHHGEPARVELNALVQEVIALAGHAFGPSIRLSALPAASAVWVSAERSQLENALLNLAINARDAMPDGGDLSLVVDTVQCGPGHCRVLGTDVCAGCYARVCVQDSGRGMDPATLARAFEPFFSTKPRHQGTGLGLTIVADTIRALRGWIDVDSAPNRGTRFVVGIPVDTAPEGPGPANGAALPAAPRQALVVDGDAPFRDLAGEALRRMGFAVALCVDGPEALAELARRAGGVDLVVLALELPRLDGLHVLRRLREVAPEVRVLLVSNGPPAAPVAEALAGGHTGFLRKPSSSAGLARAVGLLAPASGPASSGLPAAPAGTAPSRRPGGPGAASG